mmetsp:Transcript_25725/g.24584  ORF Transcript_25725/g.24584 Transcript_25725/m.24584 type:complete len:265 (+) Transcript_25725:125-919(+)|eukprot:CAMPEP_0119042374 /NCGR_PEP_ID=MMETSP1177-20130426/14887_1 /TAXON_ID=2985 /ORGANISM="Ochromonas sp, Strain CCMP1899" /LENGTH=264 /DNA_ID=CAMNT_0007009137 /DNA_START=114 /DNA_END=908 /DNA_ORIENTATION=+
MEFTDDRNVLTITNNLSIDERNERIKAAVGPTKEFVIDFNDNNLVKDFAESFFSEIKVEGSVPSEDLQAELFRLLKPKGKLSITGGSLDREAGQELSLDLKIQGFKNILAATDMGKTGERFVVCEKPSWELGTSSGIQIPESAQINTWKMNMNELADDGLVDEDLVDEDDLMDDGFVVPAPVDCGVPTGIPGKKRACKDCSCGLKEIESEAEQNGITLPDAPKSGCGSCSKGDAFRCAGCPHLGKPAFEAGSDKVILSMGDDDI